MKFRAEANGNKDHRRIMRDEEQVGQAIRLSNGSWGAFAMDGKKFTEETFKSAKAVCDWFAAHNFFIATAKHRAECKPMFDWLNENATHLAKDWDLYHSGGGHTHYHAVGEMDGKKCQFMICHEGYAEPQPVQDEPLWALIAQEIDADEEWVAEATVLEGHKDMRELVIASRNVDAKKLEWHPL